MASGFSSIMKLTDLDDFISPSLECIKPVTSVPITESSSQKDIKGLIQLEENSNFIDSGRNAPLQKATINLTDCLACSGCVTSAEVVLVTQQSHMQLLKVLQEGNMVVVVSLSPQAVLSIAHKYSLEPQDCAERLSGYFRSLGAAEVWDTNVARSISLLEAAREFEERLTAADTAALPVLASACPGWICYAEKTQPASVLKNISSVRSPQQVMGSLVTKLWAPGRNIPPDKVYHVTVMPCYDKKLEASRQEFEDQLTNTRDVSSVITSIEVEQMLLESSTNLSSVTSVPLSSALCRQGVVSSHRGSSAGGYADHVLRHVAESMYGVRLGDIEWRTLRNADLQEATLEVDGETVVRVCRAYGFRNLQNVVQKVKRGKCAYHYVEVMACPAGCLNGGAQIRVDGHASKTILPSLEDAYASLPAIDPRDDALAQDAIMQLRDSEPHFAHTTYKVVEKSVSALGIKW